MAQEQVCRPETPRQKVYLDQYPEVNALRLRGNEPV